MISLMIAIAVLFVLGASSSWPIPAGSTAAGTRRLRAGPIGSETRPQLAFKNPPSRSTASAFLSR
jgi:hypothetical protein